MNIALLFYYFAKVVADPYSHTPPVIITLTAAGDGVTLTARTDNVTLTAATDGTTETAGKA